MTTTDPATRTRALSAKTLGVLAVVGLVVAFSLSSTLVKRAESPGVLVAFWRMVTVSVVWNVLLWSTGRRVTMRQRAPGARARRLLRPEPRRLLRRGDAQQRRQRRADRLARAVPHRADRRLALQRVHRPARAGVRARRVRRRRPRAVQRAAERRRVAGGQRVRRARDAAAGRLRRVDAALPPGHGRHHLHGDDLPDRGRGGAAAGDRQRRRVRDERHGLDLHADPHASPAGSRPTG